MRTMPLKGKHLIGESRIQFDIRMNVRGENVETSRIDSLKKI